MLAELRDRLFEPVSVPLCQCRTRLVGAPKKLKNGHFWVRRQARIVVAKDEQSLLFVIMCSAGVDARRFQSGGRWIDVAVECGEAELGAARPKPNGNVLLILGDAHHPARTRGRRSRVSRESRFVEV